MPDMDISATTVMRNVRKNEWKMNIEERKEEEKIKAKNIFIQVDEDHVKERGKKGCTISKIITITSFTMMDVSEIGADKEGKTRFYFDGDKLVYIKTIIGDKQEVLKVDLSYNVDSKLFEIPSDYQEM